MEPDILTPLDQFRQSAREAVADLALTAKASSGVLSSEYLDGRIAALTAAAEELVEQELEAEHYYSHSEDDGTIQHHKLYFCACSKQELDRDRLLRHIKWNELRAAQRAALTKENQHGEN